MAGRSPEAIARARANEAERRDRQKERQQASVLEILIRRDVQPLAETYIDACRKSNAAPGDRTLEIAKKNAWTSLKAALENANVFGIAALRFAREHLEQQAHEEGQAPAPGSRSR